MDLEELVAAGRQEVDDVLRVLADIGIATPRGSALDFGCGIGRLTRALADRFDSCDGVDPAAAMIERARELSEGQPRVRFHHYDAPDLRLFDDDRFDFVLSLTALGQVEPQMTRGYLREFLRVLRPGGIAFFNVPEPAETTTPQRELHMMAPEDVAATLEDAGGVVLTMSRKDRWGPSAPSLDYVVAPAVAPTSTRSRGSQRDPRRVIEDRIRAALPDSTNASRVPSTRSLAADPNGSERRAAALRLIDERADLVSFDMGSRWKALGHASTALRVGLRRLMFQVLYRQTEHNRASNELISGHETKVEALWATVRSQLNIQAVTDERLEALERRLGPVEVNAVAEACHAAEQAGHSNLADIDSVRFAERFRGSSDEVRERQRRYVPWLAGSPEVVDLGCGRGEFLELLREAGVGAVGVDRDRALVEQCRGNGLDVVQDDALRWLRARPEASQGGIFAGHLVEHLERPEIVQLLRLALSRLRGGGVLVLVTLNPMCLVTYATFYGDFTRTAPMPPLALKWLAESCGFAPVEIEYSCPVPDEQKLRPMTSSAGDKPEVEAFNRGIAATNDLLFGFQEYALVARKPA